MNCHSLTLLPRRVLRAGLIVAFATALAGVALGASETKRYEVPAGPATATLKQFSQQSGEQIVYPTDLLRDVQTRAVSGELTARAALEQMLEGTGLVVVQDARTGALTIRTAADAEKIAAERIRQTESAGPSPVNVYDQEYIRATGAMTLADFLNYLPQNYAGISAGRGSAPNELNPDFGQRTESTFPSFNFVMGAAAVNPSQTGVSGVSLRGLGSGSTLVLVDGRRVTQSGARNRATDSGQGFVDLNTIPFGMVERIEVITDGASAIYGADAVAGVINVVLKKNWIGNELSGSFKGAFHGGGRERLLTATTGFAQGKLRGTASMSYYDRADLKASQRAFSRNQDHRDVIVGTDANGIPVTGRDLRLNWGYPAVVQALVADSNTQGTFTAIPGIRVVLVPDGVTSTPAVGQFIPVSTPVPPSAIVNASGQRRGNTAEFLDLIPESERYSFSGSLNYSFNDNFEAYGSYYYSETQGLFSSQPPVSSASATTGFGNFSTKILTGPLNPFGHAVIVGMIHYGFGSIWQKSETQAHNGLFGLRGRVGQTWEWDSGMNLQRQKSEQVSRNFHNAGITAALNHTDATLRLNPFVDARAGVDQSAAYEALALYARVDSTVKMFTWDFSANGDLFDVWGGPVKAAFGGSYSRSENSSYTLPFNVNAVNPVQPATFVEGEQESHAIFAEASFPIFGKPNAAPLFRRLDLQLAARYENYGRAGHTTVPKYGISWSPVESLLLRASFSEGFRAPALTEYQNVLPPVTSTVTDPRRTPAATPNVSVSRGSRTNVAPETSQNEFYGLVFEPPMIKGLTFEVNYYRTTQENLIQLLSAQTIVNNEALFPDRVTRAAPDANDTALGQPGAITAVDQTYVNFGQVRNESVDFVADYRLPFDGFGNWRIGASASRTLTSERQLAPGQPAIVDEGDTFAPPKWKFNASLFWNKGQWNAAMFVSYLGSFQSNLGGNSFLTFADPSPAVYKVDVRAGYEFRDGIWRGYGKGLRVQAGIGNLFDEKPPFSDTVFGYNGGLHSAWVMGRSYELSFNLPF